MPNPNNSIFASSSEPFVAVSGSLSTAAPVAKAGPGGSPLAIPRPSLEYKWRVRSRRARQKTRWKTRIEAIVQDMDRVRVLARHDIDDGEVLEALDAAVEQATLLMTPPSAEERLNPANLGHSATPLTQDVTLYWAGTVVAVVHATQAGPLVHRYLSSNPARR